MPKIRLLISSAHVIVPDCSFGFGTALKSSSPTKSAKPRAHDICPSDDVSTRSLLPPSPECPIQLDQAAKFVTSCARQRKFGSV